MKILQQGARLNAAEIGDLGEAIRALPAEGGGIYLPAGIYEVGETILCHLREGQHLYLHGDGRASVLRFSATDGSPLLDFRGVENSWWPDLKVTLRDLTFVGQHASGDALQLFWPNDILVDACFFSGFGGTAIRVTPNATNVTIRDCWLRDCRRVLHADNLHHLTFQGNQTRSANEGGLEQAENLYIGRHCREVRIVSNHLAYGHAEAIILDGTAQHVIADNCIEGFPTGILADDCRDICISSNYIHCDCGIRMRGDNRGMLVNGNVFTNTSEGAVVIESAGTSGGHVISNNVIRQSVYNDGQKGIDLGTSYACTVNGNLFEDLTDPEPAIRQEKGRHRVDGNCVTDCGSRARGLAVPGTPVEWDRKNPFSGLHDFLSSVPAETARLTVSSWEFRQHLGDEIPAAAWEDGGWWENDGARPQARAWLSAGWLVAIVKRIEGRIVFVRLHARTGMPGF